MKRLGETAVILLALLPGLGSPQVHADEFGDEGGDESSYEFGQDDLSEALDAIESKRIRVAVYQLKGRNTSPRVTEVVTNALLTELRKLERVSAIGMDEIKDMLTHEENKRILGCDDDSCLAEITGALGVDELLTGNLSQLGASSMIKVSRLDLRKGAVVRSSNQRLAPEDGEEFLAVIGPMVEELYAGYDLKPGVERGVSDQVALALNPPPLPTWVFWTTAGVALGAGVLSGGAALMAREKHESYNDTIRGSEPPSDSISNTVLRAKQEEAEIWDSATLGLLISAGILVVGASLEAIFTDWYGYGESGVDLAVVPAAAPRSMSAVLSW